MLENKYLFFGLLFSFIYSKIILPKKENGIPKIKYTCYPILYQGMVIIPTSQNSAIHLHHWICYLLLSFLLFFVNFVYIEIVFGFFIGMIIQGLLYKDKFKIYCKNPYL